MRGLLAVPLLAIFVLSAAGCGKTPEAKAAELASLKAARARELAKRIAAADANPSKKLPVAMWIVPPELKEISGLTLTPDGRVFTHDDEVATIYEIDPKAGIVLKRFSLTGERHGDFEAITTAGSDIFLMESNGKIFQFKEGADGARVPYEMFDTHLGKECEFESMAYEPDSTRLLLTCKKFESETKRPDLVMYGFPLPLRHSVTPTMITVPIDEVIGVNKWKNFHPSDMTIDPFTKNYVIISSKEKGLVVLSPDGEVVRSEPLPPGHNQPEGVAITKDSLLLISDEAHMTPAAITLYRWHP